MTHPFHPLFGREFELVTQKQAWGEDRVYVRDKKKRLHHVPLGWTSAAPADGFKAAAAGRCRFRIEDLLRLADLVDQLAGGESPPAVKTNTPQSSVNYAVAQANPRPGQRRLRRRSAERKTGRRPRKNP